MINGLSHIAFNTENMEKTLEFYCGCLGFEKIFELKHEDGTRWIEYLKIPGKLGQFFEIFYDATKRVSIDNETIGYNHFCLEVDDIEETAAHLRAKGIKLDKEPKMGLDFNYQCWARDPDGNRIEFMQMGEKSLQMAYLKQVRSKNEENS